MSFGVIMQVHGRWKIKVSGKVLMQWFADAWNEQAIIEYAKEFKQVAAPLIGQDWAIISIFEQWELGVPEIESHVAAHCAWFKDNGCVRDCHVYSYSSAKEMQLEKMIPHTEGTYVRHVYGELDEAINWLSQEGFDIPEPDFLHKLIATNNGG